MPETAAEPGAFSGSALEQLADMSVDRFRKPLKVITTFEHRHQPPILRIESCDSGASRRGRRLLLSGRGKELLSRRPEQRPGDDAHRHQHDDDLPEIGHALLQRIARFKRPKRYLAVDQLPKNSYGKVLKRELRQQLA